MEVSAVPLTFPSGQGLSVHGVTPNFGPLEPDLPLHLEEAHMHDLASHMGKDSCTSKSASIQNSQRKDKSGPYEQMPSLEQ